MADTPIYLGFPNNRLYPTMPEWVGEVRELVINDSDWDGWDLSELEYDMRSALQINDVSSAINTRVGPCVLVKPVQARVFRELRERLYGRTVVLSGSVSDSTDILVLMERARELHDAGEPMLPRKLVIALLLLAKLEKHQMWGGRNKGYMWTSDLAKGRGLPECYSDQLPAVINDLGLRELLIKKQSRGRGKYALNPDRRREIYDALRDKRFRDELHERLSFDPRIESARELDLVYEVDFERAEL